MTLDYFYGQAGELFSFLRIPKAFFQEQRFQDLSTDAKTLYGILLDRMSLSVKMNALKPSASYSPKEITAAASVSIMNWTLALWDEDGKTIYIIKYRV